MLLYHNNLSLFLFPTLSFHNLLYNSFQLYLIGCEFLFLNLQLLFKIVSALISLAIFRAHESLSYDLDHRILHQS